MVPCRRDQTKELIRTNWRHELKCPIACGDLLILRRRLQAVMERDPHAPKGRYLVRSLYFDTPQDTALQEKLEGIGRREKFRIRCYDHDHSLIRLEKKSKLAGLCAKEQADLTTEQVQALLAGDIQWLLQSPRPLFRELYLSMRYRQLVPKTIVDYTREPFVFGPGNVRVTLDYGIRTGLVSTDFLNPRCPTVPAAHDPIVLEIKWDDFLPDIIRDAVQTERGRISAFSKYACCRGCG